jgi:hypothetical protein
MDADPGKIPDHRRLNQITARRNEQGAAACFGNSVKRSLQSRTVVGNSVADGLKIRQVELIVLRVRCERTQNHECKQRN